MTVSLSYIVGVGIVGILFSLWARRKVLQAPAGSEKMRQIAAAIEEGSRAYLKRQYRVVSIVAAIIGLLLWYFLDFSSALGFMMGGIASALAG